MYLYVNVDSPNIGFPYFNFLGEVQWRKNTLYNVGNLLSMDYTVDDDVNDEDDDDSGNDQDTDDGVNENADLTSIDR